MAPDLSPTCQEAKPFMFRARILAAVLSCLVASSLHASGTGRGAPGVEIFTSDDSLVASGAISTHEALLRAKQEILAHHYFAGDPILTAPLYRTLAEICARLGQYDEAELWYGKILAFNTFEITTLLQLADMHLGRPDPDPQRADAFLIKAEMAAAKLFAGTEEEARVHTSRGRYHMVRHEYALARRQFALAIVYWGDEEPLELLYWNAECALDEGNYDESLQLYLELVGKTRGLDRRALNGLDEVNSLALEPLGESRDSLIVRAIATQARLGKERLREIGGRIVTIEAGDGFPIVGTLFHPENLRGQ